MGRVAPIAPAIAFAGLAVRPLVLIPLQHLVGLDAVLYATAARAWLTGGDPWRTTIEWGNLGGVVAFAAPPPALLLFAPFAFLPAWLTAVTWITADAVVMVLVMRNLRLPWWWLLFPPFLTAFGLGNPEPVVLGLLVLGGGRLAAVAPLLKIYAIAPLVGERRWRVLVVAVVLLGATAVLLPWGTFVADLDWIRYVITDQSQGGLSATSVPVLLPFAVVALAALGWRRACWLAVPVLWPYSQPHYALIAMPVLTPLVAVASSISVPGATAVGVILQALWEWRARIRHAWTHGMPRPDAGARDAPTQTDPALHDGVKPDT